MLKRKMGVSIISLALSVVAISLVTAALVVTLNNTADYKINKMSKKDDVVIENSAYIKIYTKNEIEAIARQAFADNYLSYYDGEVDLEGFEALVIGQIEETVPASQLENFGVVVTADEVDII